jgi:hypothetical protein
MNYYNDIYKFYENIGKLTNIAHNCGNVDAAKELRNVQMAVRDLINARHDGKFTTEGNGIDGWLHL